MRRLLNKAMSKLGVGIPYTLNGLNCKIDPTAIQYFSPTYEWEVAAYLKSIVKPSMTIFDVGANVGVYVIQLGELVDKIIAFEPDQGALKLLKRHIELNNLDNVTVIESAVSNEAGSATLYSLPSNPMNRLGEANVLIEKDSVPYNVPVTTIDGFVKESSTIPNLILMDIEGFEIAALKGATETVKNHSPILIIEMHPGKVWESANTNRKDLDDWLEEMNLKAVAISTHAPLEEDGVVLLSPQ